MTIAVVTLGVNMDAAEETLRSIDLHGGLPDGVKRLMLCDRDAPSVDFATTVPVTNDYSDLSQDADDRESFNKFSLFLLPYRQVIYVDPKMSCTGDISQLTKLSEHLLYAKRLPDGTFSDDVLVFNHDRQLGFHDALLYLTRSHLFDGYGHGFRAVINGYFSHTKRPVGHLPKCALQAR